MKKIVIFAFICLLFACNNRKISEVKNNQTGQLLIQYEYITSENGSFLKDGYYKKWHKNGQLETFGNYKNNKREGKWQSYFENGNLKEEINLKNGMIEGLVILFYGNGNKRFESNNKKNKLEGKVRYWHANGQLSSTGTYLNNSKDGLFTYYYENGTKEKEVNYKKNKLDGKYLLWYKNNNLKEESDYKNNSLNGKQTSYYKNGKKREETRYENGKPIKSSKKMWLENGDYIDCENLFGTWRDQNSTTTYRANGSCLTIWDEGQKEERDWEIKIKNNKVVISTGYWSTSTILDFKENTFSTKDRNNKIWINNRIK